MNAFILACDDDCVIDQLIDSKSAKPDIESKADLIFWSHNDHPLHNYLISKSKCQGFYHKFDKPTIRKFISRVNIIAHKAGEQPVPFADNIAAVAHAERLLPILDGAYDDAYFANLLASAEKLHNALEIVKDDFPISSPDFIYYVCN